MATTCLKNGWQDRAGFLGYVRHIGYALDSRAMHYERKGKGYMMAENLRTWVRFSELNQCSYYHIWLLGKIRESPYLVAELKKNWRYHIERASRCHKPRLP